MRTEFDRAYVTAHGKVAVLTLNHPEAMNAAGDLYGSRRLLALLDSDVDRVGQGPVAQGVHGRPA